MKYLLYLIFITGLLVSCNSSEDISSSFKKSIISWKNDKNGCYYNRTAKNTQIIIDTLKKYKLSKSDIEEILGSPDKISKNNYQYIFSGFCNESEIIDSLDFCWLNVIFNFNRVDDYYITCY